MEQSLVGKMGGAHYLFLKKNKKNKKKKQVGVVKTTSKKKQQLTLIYSMSIKSVIGLLWW